MNIIPTNIPDVLIIEPKVFSDSRGFFFEAYNAHDFAQQTGVTAHFVQDNHSRSVKGVLRGLHYQVENTQGKLVRVIHGEIRDIAVDVRKSSPTFGQWVAVHLSADNYRQLWIPPGFAHGFSVMSESAEFLYKTTDYYNPGADRCIRWDDAQLAIDWQLDEPPVLSDKDKLGVPFSEAQLLP
ncbi:dTDP-4-dehydrorhamnose 3,5-epimerase [Pseudomonas sp. NPDC089392]|uniref:dTDP-4-dehydrorhamnose 3,5-epimerase n=1 Tax=Pseudomonas sp. NPDC089392 TaxID=3364459 RepID=UPI0037FAE146